LFFGELHSDEWIFHPHIKARRRRASNRIGVLAIAGRLFVVMIFDSLVEFALEAPPLCDRPKDAAHYEIPDDAQGEADIPIDAE
jgi:hypothetical protein